VAIDGHDAGVLRVANDGYARLTVNASSGAHKAIIEMPRFALVKKQFHIRADVPLDVRVLRREIVQTSGEGECRCHDEPNVTVVFRGRVLAVRDVVEDETPIHVVTLEATKWWEGRRRSKVEVRTWDAGSRYCGVPFAIGGEYFVRAWGFKGLHTDVCTRTRPAEQAKSEMAWLDHWIGRSLEVQRPAAKIVPLTKDDASVLASIKCSQVRSRCA
jgi:hypothetical protein